MESEDTTGKQKQRRRSAAERATVLEQFHCSGLTRAAFAHSHNVALSTLSKWLTNARRESDNAAPVLFRELRVPSVPAASVMPWAVEIVGPDGLVIRCREALPWEHVAWLLRGR